MFWWITTQTASCEFNHETFPCTWNSWFNTVYTTNGRETKLVNISSQIYGAGSVLEFGYAVPKLRTWVIATLKMPWNILYATIMYGRENDGMNRDPQHWFLLHNLNTTPGWHQNVITIFETYLHHNKTCHKQQGETSVAQNSIKCSAKMH